ncbi:MAG: GNAT family N-acetyltransferase [Steroidobacteraceae bacterium]
MSTTATIKCAPLESRDWPALERLFGARGACGGCWCMLWRASYGGERFDADKGAVNRQEFRTLVMQGNAHGCLAWEGSEAVGWVSAGSRESFPYFERSRALAPLPGEGVWSVTCFFVPSAKRGAGVASALLRAAVELARDRGARIVEGYPVVPKRRAAMPAAFAWTGVPALFDAAGFTAQKHPSGRLIYRLKIGSRR